MYIIFHLKEKGQETLNTLMSDDEVGRLSITSKDGSKISDEYTGLLVMIEGQEGPVKKAEGLIGDSGEKLSEEKCAEVYRKMKEESESADQGVGFLFGE